MLILSIDTSADETSVAIVEDRRVLVSVVSSQITSHKIWGGINPGVARLAHEKRITPVVKRALKKLHGIRKIAASSKLRATSSEKTAASGELQATDSDRSPGALEYYSIKDIDAVAVTQGPGLSIALDVGIAKAKELAREWGKPLIAVNHMAGHLYSPFVQNSVGHPDGVIPDRFLSLLISGGHTQIVQSQKSKVKSENMHGEPNAESKAERAKLRESEHHFSILGETMDDAAGEALDKAAKMLGLGYPGGAVIERLAKEVGNKDFYRFPRPMIGLPTLDMSFSGLKTHLVYFLRGEKGMVVDPVAQLREIASSFQEAVFDTVIRKLDKAIVQTGITTLAVGGGVIANKRLRLLLRQLMKKHGGTVVFPPLKYLCGDNAAMIGVAAYMQTAGTISSIDLNSLSSEPRMRL
ncbi:MAG: tRNA (adenosine(37)-N6)-threonylcarbamoyltransferase complex transferase subunit TsaD [bacterium]